MKTTKIQGISRKRIEETVSYCPDTGIFYWKFRDKRQFSHPKYEIIWNARFYGKPAGSHAPSGYVVIKLDGVMLKAHRLAFFLTHGKVPPSVDHINGDRSDNRISNLRPATQVQNSFNARRSKRNSTGYKGVSYNTKRQKYVACLSVKGRHKHLGYFPTAKAAASCIRENREKYHGKFTNHGDELSCYEL